jgi:AcrR family transcriptional regulator
VPDGTRPPIAQQHGARGLARGSVWDRDGHLVATVLQQVLARPRDPRTARGVVMARTARAHPGTVAAVSSDPRGVTRHGQDRKAELLASAERLFVERGYAEARMVDIAKEAGVTKSLVYWYFDTKDALFHEIAVDMRRRLRRAQSAAIDGVDDPLARLYLGTATSVRFIAEHHRLYGLITALLPGDRRLRATQSQSRRVLADDAAALLAEGQDRGLVHPGEDPAALAHANAGVVTNFVLLYSDSLNGPGAEAIEVEDVAHAAARYVVRAVACDRGRAEAVVAACGDERRLRLGPTTPVP